MAASRCWPALCVLSAILPMAMFSLMAGGSQTEALLGAVVLAMVAGGVSAVGAVATAEQFGGRRPAERTGVRRDHGDRDLRRLHALSRAVAARPDGIAGIPGAMIAVVALAVLPLFLTMAETAPRRERTGPSSVQSGDAIEGP